MDTQRIILGIDFSRQRADVCLLNGAGEVLVAHQGCPNTPTGVAQAKQLLLSYLHGEPGATVQIGAEATSWYWLPFFWQLARDPQLVEFDPQLYLLNPLWVKWYKKSLPKDNKSDRDDPFYVADRVRTRPPTTAWQPQPDWLPLRFLTRYRFHLAQQLTREKNYGQLFLFLRYSGYSPARPFSDPWALTARALLTQPEVFAAWQDLAPGAQIQALEELSHHRLPHPADNAARLRQAWQDSFPLEAALVPAVQQVLDWSLAQIAALESCLRQVDAWIEADLQTQHPGLLCLTSIPGYGPVYASGVGAEIGGVDRFFHGDKRDPRTGQQRPKNQRDAEDSLAKWAGLWWPLNQSGEFSAEERPLAKTGNRYLRYYLIEGADSLRQHLPEYTRYYERKYHEVKKHAHQRALVLTARKSLGLIVGLLHRKEAYRSKETSGQ